MSPIKNPTKTIPIIEAKAKAPLFIYCCSIIVRLLIFASAMNPQTDIGKIAKIDRIFLVIPYNLKNKIKSIYKSSIYS